jgi:hypothetical protein
MDKNDLNRNKNSRLFAQVLSYLIWLIILIFWGVLFNYFLGKKIGFVAGAPAIIFAYATVHIIEYILKKIRSK